MNPVVLTTEFHPATESNSKRLMVVLHGLGDSIGGYRWLPSMLGLPWMNYLLVNAPDSYYGGYSWYDFTGDPGPGILRSRELLFALLDKQRQSGYSTEETTLFGFSQGCLMTWEAGLHYPHRFAGLVGISGYAHEPEHALKHLAPMALQQRFLITHGTLDPLIPFASVRAQITVLQRAGLRIEWREFPKVHTIAGQEELEVIRQFVRAGY